MALDDSESEYDDEEEEEEVEEGEGTDMESDLEETKDEGSHKNKTQYLAIVLLFLQFNSKFVVLLRSS